MTEDLVHVLQASVGGYMVAFAGRKYAARSLIFVSNSSVTVSSFTLVRNY
jgi:hypothetical protein